MSAKYVDISLEEFEKFTNDWSAERIIIPGTLENVYVINRNKARALIYSSITSKKNREVGKDAIRVILEVKDEDSKRGWRTIWNSKRVNRVASWKFNLTSRITDALDRIGGNCPNCDGFLIQIDGKAGPFWSCSNWTKTKCTGKANVHNRESQNGTNENGVCERRRDVPRRNQLENNSGSRAGALSADVPCNRRESGSSKEPKNNGATRSIKIRYPKIVYNEDQKKVIDFYKGPVIVSAGAGSGKTASIVERIVNLINNHDIDPSSILCTTFTRNGAAVMNKRLQSKGIDTTQMSVQTMHSFCYGIVMEKLKKHGWEIDEKDIYGLILKEVINWKNMKWRCDITLLESFIALAKNNLVRPENAESWDKLKEFPFYNDKRYCEAYFLAEELRRTKRLITMDDLLIDGVEILQQNEETRLKIQKKYKYVIVDEFQDSNKAQIVLTELVAAPQWNLMVVGDIDQAIYQWRGAMPDFMIEFSEKYKANVISMGINYRSSKSIVSHAAHCITNNNKRISKELTTNKTSIGTIKCKECLDLDEEARAVADEIQQLVNDDIKYNDIYCLYRTNAQSRALEEVFGNRKIPYIVLGAGSFYERKEIQDLLAYIKLVDNPKDEVAGARAINRPFRYIRKDVIEEIADRTIEFGSFVNSAEEVNKRIKNRNIELFVDLIKFLEESHTVGVKTKTFNVGTLIGEVVSRTNFLNYLIENEGSDTAENSRAANVGEMIRSADRYSDIPDFLNFVKMQIEERKKKNKDKNSVICMTIHKSKGLEAHAVFVLGANEGILPHGSSIDPNVEEERRLFYVACTRAKEFLHISYIQQLGMSGKRLERSRFLKEAQIENGDLHVKSELA